MQLIVHANDILREEWLQKNSSANYDIVWVKDVEEFKNYPDANAYFDLQPGHDGDYPDGKIVFVNEVEKLLKESSNNHVVRINAWPGFLKRNKIELVASDENKDRVRSIMDQLGWQFEFVNDMPGMISARIISMIVNEAYFALGEGVSTKGEIDTAMKLGTNYPFGPFEWSELIGLEKIHNLLKKLSAEDERYAVAPELEKEFLKLEKYSKVK